MGERVREVRVWHCEICGWEWIGRNLSQQRPRYCTGCGSAKWYDGESLPPMPKRLRRVHLARPKGARALPTAVPPSQAGKTILKILERLDEQQKSPTV